MGDENPPTPSTSSAARKKEEKARKKDQRSWENVMKSMGDMPEAERIGVIQQRYTSLYNDLRHTAVNYQSLEKKFITLQKERDQARTELNKNILAKAKLESLCRELQKQNKAIKGEEYDENEELISMPSDDEAYQQEAWQEQIIQLLDPCAVDPELLTAENNDPHVMDFSDVEMDAAGDGTIPQLEAHYSVPIADTDSDTSGENLDDTVINLEQPSSSSEILVKEVRSVPITKKDHEAIDENNFEELQSSTGDLHGDLSMETLPLYKPIAVTDVPTQGGHVTLVKESEARTNILDPTTEEESEEQSVPSEDTESSATIHLKESEGKTEFSQE